LELLADSGILEQVNNEINSRYRISLMEKLGWPGWFLVLFLGTGILWGMLFAHQPLGQLGEQIVGLAVSEFLALWAIYDSRRRGRPIPVLSQDWLLAFAVVLVPLYVLWCRGWRGGVAIGLTVFAWSLLSNVVLQLYWRWSIGA